MQCRSCFPPVLCIHSLSFPIANCCEAIFSSRSLHCFLSRFLCKIRFYLYLCHCPLSILQSIFRCAFFSTISVKSNEFLLKWMSKWVNDWMSECEFFYECVCVLHVVPGFDLFAVGSSWLLSLHLYVTFKIRVMFHSHVLNCQHHDFVTNLLMISSIVVCSRAFCCFCYVVMHPRNNPCRSHSSIRYHHHLNL